MAPSTLALLAHARLASLALAVAFGIVAMSLGINALVKSNNQKSVLRHDIPAGTTISVDTHDVLASGVVVTVVSGLIALTAFLALVHAFLSRFRWAKSTPRAPLHARTLPLLGANVLAFLAVWLFATLVPFADFVANRQAKISASIGSFPVPQSIIQAQEKVLGLTPVYHKLGYLVSGAVLPWFAFLFASTSAVLSYASVRHAAAVGYAQAGSPTSVRGADGDVKAEEGEKKREMEA